MPHAYGWTEPDPPDHYERQRDAWHDNVLYPRDELALVRELAADGIIPPIADSASHVDAEWRSDESDWDADYDRYAGSYARQCIELVYDSIYTYTDDDGNDTPVTCYVELLWDLSDGSVHSVTFEYVH